MAFYFVQPGNILFPGQNTPVKLRITVRAGDAAIGGGIFIGQPLTLDLDDVVIVDNDASIGAGLHVQQNSRATAATLRNCVIARNHASIGAGPRCAS